MKTTLDFLNSINSVSGQFLQMNGFRFRSDEEIIILMQGLSMHGVGHLNFTFYGDESYHDCFAGRKGDFQFLRRLAKAALREKIKISAGIMLSSENCNQIDNLLIQLNESGINHVSLLVPHEEGRGAELRPIRLNEKAFATLGGDAAALFNRN